MSYIRSEHSPRRATYGAPVRTLQVLGALQKPLLQLSLQRFQEQSGFNDRQNAHRIRRDDMMPTLTVDMNSIQQ